MSNDPFLELFYSLKAGLSNGWSRIIRELDSVRIATGTLIVLLFFLVTSVVVLTGFLMLLCCAKRPKRGKSQKDLLCKKGLFALMLARLDEFDSLTPLIVTPGTPLDAKDVSASTSSSVAHPARTSSSTSPPPPRRPQAGRTLLVPLNTRYRAPIVPLLGTPESRVTTFEAGTTKSCATIPEDDEETCDDLVSIDRTSYSNCAPEQSRRHYSQSAYNLQMTEHPPEFQIPTPTYEPPPLPGEPQPRPNKLQHRPPEKPPRQEIRLDMEPKRQKKSPETPTTSLSSPQSSLGSNSPVDTTGSLSDSFYIDPAYAKDADKRTEVDATGKFQLHRIEEESEHFSEDRGIDVDGAGTGFDIPRSISQQFEMLQLQRLKKEQQQHHQQHV